MKRIGYIDGRRVGGFTLAGTVALSGINLPITDTSTPSSGISRGLYLNYAQSGIKTGSAEVNVLAIDLAVTGAVLRGICLSLYTAAIANKTIDGLHALDVYMEDPGTACGRYFALNLQQAPTNVIADSGFLRMRNAGSAIVKQIFRIEGNNSATYLLRLGAGLPYSVANPSALDGKIAIDYNGTTKYLAVYSS